MCLKVPATEVAAVAGGRAGVWDALRARCRRDVGELTHSNSAYGLSSELKACIISEILVSAGPGEEEDVTIWSIVPTFFVAVLPDGS